MNSLKEVAERASNPIVQHFADAVSAGKLSDEQATLRCIEALAAYNGHLKKKLEAALAKSSGPPLVIEVESLEGIPKELMEKLLAK